MCSKLYPLHLMLSKNISSEILLPALKSKIFHCKKWKNKNQETNNKTQKIPQNHKKPKKK